MLTLEDSDGIDDGDDDGGDEDLDKYVLWVEIKKQVAILREGIEHEDRGDEVGTRCAVSGLWKAGIAAR